MNRVSKYEQDLLASIPVVSGMDIKIVSISDSSVTLFAPLNTNINYEGTAFGGSLNTLCILSCYLLTHHLLQLADYDIESLVIQNSEVKYLSPVSLDFKAHAAVEDESIRKFLKTLERKKMARIELSSVVTSDDQIPQVEFKGRFVAKVK